jgi:SAM-dependent methyltransferase
MSSNQSSDLYSRITEIEPATLEFIAELLERRGRDPRQVAIRDRYLATIPDWEAKAVVELGSGTGVVSRELARLAGSNGRVIGIDPSPTFVEVARRNAAGVDNLDFRLGDATSLDLADASADIVVAATLLCHVPARDRVIHEMERILRPGGRVLIFDADYASNQLEHPDPAMTRRIIDGWRESMVDDPRVMRRISGMLERARLRVERFDAHVHVEAGHVDRDTSFLWAWRNIASRQALSVGAITQAEADTWLAQLDSFEAEGRFFGTITYFSVLAVK